MARSSAHTKTHGTAFAVVVLCAVALVGASLFVGLNTASGADESNSYTLGLGAQRQTIDTETYAFNAEAKLGVADAPASVVEGLAIATQRNAVERPTSSEGSSSLPDGSPAPFEGASLPVVELAAVDLGDPATIRAAAKIGVLNPPESAKLRTIDTSGEGWKTGMASGYDVASSSTLTRSGRAFDDNCVTVAVPEGMEDLLGHPIVIVYGNKVVVATVTDTGGFAKYGRALDLGGGVFKAFGHEDIWDWGVREVKYKFL